jgi:hypothetical protein
MKTSIRGVEEMSFTIKCNKCGNEQEFTNESNKFQDNIGVDVYVRGTYMGDVVESIEIECGKCCHNIELKY